MVRNVGYNMGRRVEMAIDSINTDLFSVISINKGDTKLIEKNMLKVKKSKSKVTKELVIAFTVGVISSLVAGLISYIIQ